MALPQIPELKELMDAGVHFGHASGRWHPKMAPYIFGARDHLHIINLEKTREQLQNVLPILEERIASGKSFILVGSKKQATAMVREMGERLGISYVNERWLGGTMTNFQQMLTSIRRMVDTEELLASDRAQRLTKKERVVLQSELKRMHIKFSGLRTIKRKPDFLIVVDPAHEHNAVREAIVEGIETFALVDTNADPSRVTFAIPTNDDGPKALRLMLALLEQTIASGLEKLATRKADAAASRDAEKEEAKIEKSKVADADEVIEVAEKLEEEVVRQVKEAKSAKASNKED